MTAQSFTRNYTDHSNSYGFQFEFHCDKCGNGLRSPFKSHLLGVAASFLKAAGSVFGSTIRDIGWGADHVKDALRGSAWDEAFQAAITEIKPRFRQCTQCGKWVCPEVCWNAKRGLCEECAPDLQEHAASAQAQAAVEQIRNEARQYDLVSGINMEQMQVAACGSCGTPLQPDARFCASCGKSTSTTAAASFCSGCGKSIISDARFCPGCGKPVSS